MRSPARDGRVLDEELHDDEAVTLVGAEVLYVDVPFGGVSAAGGLYDARDGVLDIVGIDENEAFEDAALRDVLELVGDEEVDAFELL